jgi:hypothetical protein
MSEEYEVSSDRPIDDVVAGLIDGIRDKKRGFVLGIAQESEGEVSIEVKESLPPHDEWKPPANLRKHTIEDTESFIAYARRYGNLTASLVLYCDSKAVIVIDEHVDRGDREIIAMPF